MKSALGLGALALTIFAGPGAFAQQRGDWVLGQWRDGPAWFPGVVTARAGNSVTIRYDDGTTETRLLTQVRPYDWHVGSRVTCRWTNGAWYGAHITAMGTDGTSLSVLFDDGDRLDTLTGRCRVDG